MKFIVIAFMCALLAVSTIPIHIITGYKLVMTIGGVLIAASFIFAAIGVWKIYREVIE